MKLKCRINEVDYDIVQGASFTDNLNETLDSGTICIDQVPEIKGLKPYDDVYIWDATEEFNGYYNTGDILDISKNTMSVSKDVEQTVHSQPFETDEFLGTDDIVVRKYGSIFRISGNYINIIKYIIDNEILAADTSTSTEYRYKFPAIKLSGTYQYAETTYTCEMTLLPTISDTEGHISGVYLSVALGGSSIITIDANIIGNTIEFLNRLSNGLTIYGYLASVTVLTGQSSITEYSSFYKTFDITMDDFRNQIMTLQTFAMRALYKGTWVTFNGEIQTRRVIPRPPYFVMYVTSEGLSNPVTAEFIISYISPASDSSVPILLPSDMPSSSSGDIIKIVISNSDFEDGFFGLVDDVEIIKATAECNINSDLPEKFYKHLLIDSFQKNRLNLNEAFDSTKTLFRYTINLFSETKKLEKIILPNISITQSLVASEKRTCWFYLEKYIELYSPKYKKILNAVDGTWHYVQKYSISENLNDYLEDGTTQFVTNLKEVFDSTICPEMSWTSPNLRDVLNQIFSVKDLVPVVFNDVIYGLNIGALDENLPTFSRNGMGSDTSSMSSSDYATDARREYGNALTQESSAHLIEYMGFRSPNSAFLNLSTMQLETRFPIYKINSIKMCYYKKYSLLNSNREVVKTQTFLCKHDITPLVLQNSVRNSLTTNWETYQDEQGNISYSNISSEEAGKTVKEKLEYIAKKSKLCTIGYDIGSNVISGWGTTYSYLDFLWFKSSYSYIENIIRLLDVIDEPGSDVFVSVLQGKTGSYSVNCESGGGIDGIIVFNGGDNSNTTNKLKSIVFEIDYDAMYSGAVIHNKDYIEDDDITTVDNCSSALAILETDGLYEKEKLNRMSNEQFKFTARYDATNGGALMTQVQQIGTLDRGVTDATVYQREYQIFDNCILANYSAMYNYVLKNYYTSVWAKYRTYSYMSYGESVKRTENRRQLILLSTDKQYYETEGVLENSPEFFTNMFSFLTPSNIDDYGEKENLSQINCGYFKFGDKMYLSDINSFATGNSLCFNISMLDNISGGTYVDSMSESLHFQVSVLSGLDELLGTNFAGDTVKDYSTTQSWYNITNSQSDAYIETVGFYVCHLDKNGYFGNTIEENTSYVEKSGRMTALPLLKDEGSDYITHLIGGDFQMCKDNKERIDFTFQFNFVSGDKETIMVSPWSTKLNDLVGYYNKYEETKRQWTKMSDTIPVDFYIIQAGEEDTSRKDWDSLIDKCVCIKMKHSDFEIIKSNLLSEKSVDFVNTSMPSNHFYLNEEGGHDILSHGYISWNISYRLNTAKFVFNSINSYVKDSSGQEKLIISMSSQFDMVYTYDMLTLFYRMKGSRITELYIKNNFTSEFTLQKQVTDDDGTVYDFLCARVSHEYFYAGVAEYLGGLYLPDYACVPYLLGDRTFSEIVDTLDDNNSVHFTSAVDADASEKKTVVTNMVVITSTEKLNPVLVYDTFVTTLEDEESGETTINGLLSTMTVDTAGYNGKTSGHLAQEVFQLDPESAQINVKCSLYSSEIKSVQYYYKDDSGVLHFVFGVNTEQDDDGNNKDMTIYLSCVSKRSMKVYNDMHRCIGTAVNYADEDATVSYGTGQYYKEND